MFEKEVWNDTVLYLMEKNPEIDPSEMVTLVYMADIYHLILWGRTITDSIKNKVYMLMESGDMKKIMDELKGKTSNFEGLSETDKEALDFVVMRSGLDGFHCIPMCFGLKEPFLPN